MIRTKLLTPLARAGTAIRARLARTGTGPAAVTAIVLAGPGYNPASPGNAPGQAAVQELLNTIAFYCGWVCLAAFAVGAAMWAIGGRVMHSGHGAAMG
jgi:hypothetical protein